jgi:hypothetical protein
MSQIPIELTEKQFEAHVKPYLCQAKRGFVCQIQLHQVFNYILYWLPMGTFANRLGSGFRKKISATVPFTIIFPSGVTIKA